MEWWWSELLLHCLTENKRLFGSFTLKACATFVMLLYVYCCVFLPAHSASTHKCTCKESSIKLIVALLHSACVSWLPPFYVFSLKWCIFFFACCLCLWTMGLWVKLYCRHGPSRHPHPLQIPLSCLLLCVLLSTFNNTCYCLNGGCVLNSTDERWPLECIELHRGWRDGVMGWKERWHIRWLNASNEAWAVAVCSLDSLISTTQCSLAGVQKHTHLPPSHALGWP